MTDTTTRFTLRQLPLPAKLVITCFLLAVGGGYTAAMLQLHLQDSKSGKPMPTMHDVVLKYTGKKWFETQADVPKPVSLFVKLIMAEEEGLPFTGTGTMSPAFFNKCPEFTRVGRGGEDQRQRLRGERNGERAVLVLWAESPADKRKQAYQDDHFGVEPEHMPKQFTKEFRGPGDAVKVKSIIENRCTRCHKTGGDDIKAANFPLVSYADIEKYLSAPATAPFRSGGDWVRVQEPISIEKLTQSTHAHLLSFAVLFSLTGLVFAFSSYPCSLRCVLGPWVLLAVVADVSLWWLARQCNEWGPYFAMGIIGTGAAAGVGLAGQIILSVFNLYGPKGKFIMLLLFTLGGTIAGLVFLNQIKPALEEKARPPAVSAEAGNLPRNETGNGKLPQAALDAATTASQLANRILYPRTQETAVSKESRVQQVFRFPLQRQDGTDYPVLEMPFKNPPHKNMVRAFFDQDGNIFKKVEDPADREVLMKERHGELAVFLAWSKLPDPERRGSYEADAFALPPELAGKPFTADYLKNGKVQINALITDRCIRCHADEEKAEFSDYNGLLKYLK